MASMNIQPPNVIDILDSLKEAERLLSSESIQERNNPVGSNLILI
jgi:hypothetical protein